MLYEHEHKTLTAAEYLRDVKKKNLIANSCYFDN